jgi:hypothetical protein
MPFITLTLYFVLINNFKSMNVRMSFIIIPASHVPANCILQKFTTLFIIHGMVMDHWDF